MIIPGSEQFFPILHSKFSPIFDYLDGFNFYIKGRCFRPIRRNL